MDQSLVHEFRHDSQVLPVIERKMIKAAAHITGGGLPGNVVRILPDGVDAELDAATWTISPVFGWVAAVGRVSASEMLRTFNLGLGMVLVVASHHLDEATTLLKERGGKPFVVGKLKAHEGGGECQVSSLDRPITKKMSACKFSVYFYETIAQTSQENINQGIFENNLKNAEKIH